MSSNVAELFQQASELSEADRAMLAALLVDSLDPEEAEVFDNLQDAAERWPMSEDGTRRALLRDFRFP